MELTGWDRETSPFHAGEQELQDRLGRKERQDRISRNIHRPYMPDQHREFFAALPYFIAGSVDDQGWPWASMLFGQPGFLATPDDRSLTIAGGRIAGDPFWQNTAAGVPVGFLGIELPTRRRNRVNGVVRQAGDDLTVDVVQSYGNCPQYINARRATFTRDPDQPFSPKVERFTTLEPATAEVIRAADTLFVASHNDRDDKFDTGGVDASHRGGRPGFVKVEGNTLTIPEFLGNFAFNTLGNFLVTPKTGLLFVDFVTGDLMQLTGTVELLWEPEGEVKTFKGAERAWRFHLDHGQILRGASPISWQAQDASPNVSFTGTWAEARQIQRAEARRQEWHEARVIRVEDESRVVRSFYLKPADGAPVFPYKPGQFLTLRVTPEEGEAPQTRTYTLSSAPSDPHYRISVKRDGAVSTFLHDHLKVGDAISIRAPKGAFWLDTEERRPAVLIAGGIGITPMISMARQSIVDGFMRRNQRPLTVLHAASSTSDRAFVGDFTKLQNASQGVIRYVSIISNPEADEEPGRHFHASGRITLELLQRLLPLDDYDFLLCGPPAFMQALYDMLIGLGVQDHRIMAEAFGPASLNRRRQDTREAPRFTPIDAAVVTFAKTGVEQSWTPEDGTLLEFAEAHGLTPAFGCRSGSCGSCATRLLSGKVGYQTPPDHTPDPGEVLICCAVPTQSDEPLSLDL
ncbi:pyridoxamine 5'-phosphate oxidase family protein [Rhodobacteraceae bacterium NNCM2]|nr:pyridoxamine 5'-phosphate oxidase family protein [Coraliihabitans acroporae]